MAVRGLSSLGRLCSLLVALFVVVAGAVLPDSKAVNSNSVLVEKALLLHTLEDAVSNHNITIFAPRNEALDPDFKRFLLEPRNLRSLQTLILSHIVPRRLSLHNWPPNAKQYGALSLELATDASSGHRLFGAITGSVNVAPTAD